MKSEVKLLNASVHMALYVGALRGNAGSHHFSSTVKQTQNLQQQNEATDGRIKLAHTRKCGEKSFQGAFVIWEAESSDESCALFILSIWVPERQH